MPFDLDALKGKTIDDKLHGEIAAHLAELTSRAETAEGKARTAQKESMDGRKQLKAERDAAFEKLGVTTLDELEALPEPKGQGEALKQFEARLKKAEREKADAVAALSDLQGRYSAERREAAVMKAVASHPFIDADDARALISLRVKAEGDDFLFESADGKLVPLADGAAWLAKTKPHLVRAPGDGATGSGFKGSSQGGGGVNPFAKDTFNLTEQVRLARENPAQAQALKAAAGLVT